MRSLDRVSPIPKMDSSFLPARCPRFSAYSQVLRAGETAETFGRRDRNMFIGKTVKGLGSTVYGAECIDPKITIRKERQVVRPVVVLNFPSVPRL